METDDKEQPDTPAERNQRWGQQRRLEFIDFRLKWDGRLNRSDLRTYFNISIPQASLDIAKYAELAPQNLRYDRTSRLYEGARDFTALYPSTHPKRYLGELLALERGILSQDEALAGWRPPVDCVHLPDRGVDDKTLVALLKAVRERRAIEITYQSMSRPEPTNRVIFPHALANDGFRWHTRAFCYKRNKYLDFVLGRITQIGELQSADPLPPQDAEWDNVLTLVLMPHPDLKDGKRRAIELDYDMQDGHVELKCREALLFYTLKQLGLNKKSGITAEEQHIVLENFEEIEPYLTKALTPNI